MPEKVTLQITSDKEEQARWWDEARRHRLKIGQWLRLVVEGKLPALPFTGGSQSRDSLGERLLRLAPLGRFGKTEVPTFAAQLGATPRQVWAAIGSLLASKRLTRVGAGFVVNESKE